MDGSKLSLKALARTLTEVSSYADRLLRRDYTDQLREMKDGGFPLDPPPPMQLAGMRVSFAACIDGSDGDEGDILLDFSKPDGNFKGELILRPYGSEAVYFSDDVPCEESECREEETDADTEETFFECSQDCDLSY